MKIKNPILDPARVGRTDAGDPFILREGDMYYYCYTAYNELYIARFRNLADIEKAEVKKVYDKEKQGDLGSWFAPELHKIGNRWYVYAAPGCKGNLGCHSMHVLRSKTEDIFGEYEFLGNMHGLENTWAIDGTVFTHEGKLYMAVSWNGITVVELSDPLTLTENRAVVCTPDREWERMMSPVTEGSFMLRKGKNLHMLYSASDCRSEHYCLALLTFVGGDILDPKNWEKSEKPLFTLTDGIYGPGHCSVTKTPDGRDILVYHARMYSCDNNAGELVNNWQRRCVYYGNIDWVDDYPVLGKPVHELEV